MDLVCTLLIFLCPENGQFSPDLGEISLLDYPENLEKNNKNPLAKNQKNPVETVPQNCRCLSLVVVERVLTLWHEIVIKQLLESYSP